MDPYFQAVISRKFCGDFRGFSYLLENPLRPQVPLPSHTSPSYIVYTLYVSRSRDFDCGDVGENAPRPAQPRSARDRTRTTPAHHEG